MSEFGSFVDHSASKKSVFNLQLRLLLAHLSQRLIGELIVYTGIRRPSVRPSSVRPSTFSNDISSEAVRPIFSILHTKHLQVGGTKSCVFYSGRIRTLVAMATYSFHRLIMEKVEICIFFLSQWRYLEFFLQKCLLSSPLCFI